LLGALLLGEHVDGHVVGAMAVILLGVLIITRAKARPPAAVAGRSVRAGET
jgi:drug/metabolite transporter (DMT)-like permease